MRKKMERIRHLPNPLFLYTKPKYIKNHSIILLFLRDIGMEILWYCRRFKMILPDGIWESGPAPS